MPNFERELLFAALISRRHDDWLSGAAESVCEWFENPSDSLGGILVREGVMNIDECASAYEEADARIAAYQGDSQAALSSLGADALNPLSGGLASTLRREEAATNATTSADEDLLIVNELENRYKTLREQGAGGGGRVLLVHDRSLGRNIALKELLNQHAQTLNARASAEGPVAARFLREARLTSQLEHPGIVPVYEVGRRENGSPYYTMKLVKGTTLAEAISVASTLTERLKLLSHFEDLCQTIDYAHSRGVIHRDIKPSNTMVGKYGETVVLDWGLAKFADQDDDVEYSPVEVDDRLHLGAEAAHLKTAHGQILGTPAYMAPEQARGDLAAVDFRSDIYALGAVLYTLLTRRHPFEEYSPSDVIHAVLTREPVHIKVLEPKAPRELITICRKAMAKDPSQRYERAQDLIEEIRRFQVGALVEAHEYGIGERIGRFLQRYRGSAITALAASLLLAGVATLFSGNMFRLNKELDTALDVALERQVATELANAELKWENYAGSLAIIQKAAGDRNFARANELLSQSPVEHRNWEWGWLRRLSQPAVWSLTDERTPENTFGMLGKVELSPDGRYMLCYRFHSGIKHIYDLQEGKNVFFKRFAADSGWPEATGFTPDGRFFYTPLNHQRVIMWDYLLDRKVGVFDARSEDLRSFVVSPNGERAAGFVRIQPDEGKLVLWEVPSGVLLKEFPLRDLPPDSPILLAGESAERFLSPYSGKVLGFFKDNRRLAFADTHLAVLDTDTGAIQRYVKYAIAADFSTPSGIAVARKPDGYLDVWDLENSTHIRTLDHHLLQNRAVAISDDGREIVTNAEGLSKISVETGEVLWHMNHHRWTPNFSSNGKAIVAFDINSARAFEIFSAASPRDHTYVDFRDESGEDTEGIFRGSFDAQPVYAFNRARTLLVSGDGMGTLNVWRLPSLIRVKRIAAHSSELRWVAFSLDGQRIATAAADSVKLWDYATGELLLTIPAKDGTEMFSCAVAADGQRVAVAGGDPQSTAAPPNQAWVVDANTGEELFTVSGHKGTIRFVQYSPDGKWLITGGFGPPAVPDAASFKIWDAETGSDLMGQIDGMNWAWHVSFSGDNTKMLALGLSLDPVMWDLVNHKELYRLKKAAAFQVEFHPSADRFCLVSEQHGVKLFSAEDGRELIFMGEGKNPVAFLNEGRDLLVNIDDNQMKILHTDDWTISSPDTDFELRRQEAYALTNTDV